MKTVVTPLQVWVAIASLCFGLSVGLSAGFTVYWVHHANQVQCSALNIIVSDAQLQNQTFKSALIEWAKGDGCQL